MKRSIAAQVSLAVKFAAMRSATPQTPIAISRVHGSPA
jgi:hypothetical protein